jgi:hypothetical protein
MTRFLALSLSLALILPSLALAQQPPDGPVLVGSKVRILAPSVVGGRLEGTVSEIDEESLLMLQNNHPWRVPRHAITHLEVSTGSHRQALKGMLVGAGIGAVIIGAVRVPVAGCGNCLSSHGEAALLGLGVGAAYGVGIGALIKTDRWSPVPLEHVRLSVAPTRGRGVGVTASIAWR